MFEKRLTSVITSEDIEDMFLLTELGRDPYEAIDIVFDRLHWTMRQRQHNLTWERTYVRLRKRQAQARRTARRQKLVDSK